jgi:tetratricopeptide (TPR) repeat protein
MKRTGVSAALLLAVGLVGCQTGNHNREPTRAPQTAEAVEPEHVHEHGVVEFPVSCTDEARQLIEHGLGMLHHMMYEQARPHFASAAKADPSCAMAYWGMAMTRFQPLWHPTSEEDLARGRAAVRKATELDAPTARERRYIAAARTFFADPTPSPEEAARDHEARLEAWKGAQRALHEAHPEDVDAAAFYALAEISYAMTQFSPDEPRDYTRERRAGAVLERYFPEHPEHPGLFHYLIHAYDSAELAHKAVPYAEAYDELAPDVPHALHMPSHIFVRLGRWEETAEWNERSAEAALRQPVDGITSMHYPHALDYMMYAYLQLADEERARATLRRVEAIEEVQPLFASAYGIAAARARYPLERGDWAAAAELEPRTPDALDWTRFPAAEALVHYARGLGAARTGALEAAEVEQGRIETCVDVLRERGDDYWATMTEALGMAVGAWIAHERGDTTRAIARMREAAELEASMDKHPITPGEILPVRELHGELLLLADRPEEARRAFQTSLERTPNRRNALAGVERATTMIRTAAAS